MALDVVRPRCQMNQILVFNGQSLQVVVAPPDDVIIRPSIEPDLGRSTLQSWSTQREDYDYN